MSLRKFMFGATAAAIAVAFGASAGAADKPVYGVLLKTLSNPFWGAMEKGIKDGATAAGVEYFMQAVESDQAAEPQLNTCNTMLQRKPVVMITASINSTILLPCLKQANDMGIPVVDLDANLDHAIAAKAGVKIAFTIGSDNLAAGKQGADWLAGKLGKDAKGPVLVIEGLSGNRPEAGAGLQGRARQGGARLERRRLASRRLGRAEGGQHHQRHAHPQPRPGGDLLRQRHHGPRRRRGRLRRRQRG
jgi:ABC-type sugar transport system substrate-binding protein